MVVERPDGPGRRQARRRLAGPPADRHPIVRLLRRADLPEGAVRAELHPGQRHVGGGRGHLGARRPPVEGPPRLDARPGEGGPQGDRLADGDSVGQPAGCRPRAARRRARRHPAVDDADVPEQRPGLDRRQPGRHLRADRVPRWDHDDYPG